MSGTIVSQSNQKSRSPEDFALFGGGLVFLSVSIGMGWLLKCLGWDWGLCVWLWWARWIITVSGALIVVASLADFIDGTDRPVRAFYCVTFCLYVWCGYHKVGMPMEDCHSRLDDSAVTSSSPDDFSPSKDKPFNTHQYQIIPDRISAAKQQVQQIEQKRLRMERILNEALNDRNELATQLHSVGVNSPADLKGNIRGQRLAEKLATIGVEIEVHERHLANLSSDVLSGSAIVRCLKREQVRLSDSEKQHLDLQLREGEDKTIGIRSPITPLDLDLAVEAALKGLQPPSISP